MIKIIKLISGEEIVSEVEKKEGLFILNKPHRLFLSQEGLASMPMCPFAKDSKFEIKSEHVLFESEPEDEIRDSYANQVGSIVIPSKNLLTP